MKNRKPWYDASTLSELGELTAQWLTGELDNHPGSYGVEDETHPIAADLARINRGGLVTYESQPGKLGEAWSQKAAVSGFATPETWARIEAAVTEFNRTRLDDASYLDHLIDADGIGAYARPVAVGKWWGPSFRLGGVMVSEVNGKGACEFGRQMTARDINRWLFPYGNTEGIAAACAALQVTVWDHQPGNDRMWAVLTEALDPADAGV